jgi:glycosyltransferase involved in cell wall biosynthesis
LNVLYVAEAFGGGLFEITRKKAEGLVQRGHRATIAYGVRPETPADPRTVIDDRVHLIAMPWTSRTVRAQVQALCALRTLIAELQPDVVHLMSSFAGLHGALALGGGGHVPTVYTPQGYAFTMSSEPRVKRAAYRAVETFVAHRVSLVGACSQTEGDQARSLAGGPRVAVVENGIAELDRVAAERPVSRRRPSVVALGRPSPQRRPDGCARILAAVSDLADVRWIGGGPESEGTRALEDAGVPVSGWLPRAQTLERLGQATVYLHWTAWDGLPLSILEALARDVIVVASDIGPNAEVVGPDQVRTSEPDAIALIRDILTNPPLAVQLLARQRGLRGRYSAERMVDQWIEVYEGLAREASGTVPPTLTMSDAA